MTLTNEALASSRLDGETQIAPIRFTVHGIPQPAGSKRAFPFKKQNGQLGVRVTDANEKAKNWQGAVSQAAAEAYSGELLRGPVALSLRFYRPRGKGHYGSGRNASKLKPTAPQWHTQAPDATKLTRAVEDALSGVVWADDAQVVRQVVTKDWGEPARVEIEVQAL